MDPPTYLGHLRADGKRLADVADGRLDLPVPSCPGWSVADLVVHTGAVFGHKTGVLLSGSLEAPGAMGPRPEPGEDVVAWYRRQLAELVAALAATPPDRPIWTWYPPVQATRFWYRRMAQEAVVHRLDAEQAAGTPQPIDPGLAVDGVDEVLTVFLVTERKGQDVGGRGQTIEVSADGRAWTIVLEPRRVTVDGRQGVGVGLRVSGAPAPVLCWLWGRDGDGAVTIDGDPDLLGLLRTNLVAATG